VGVLEKSDLIASFVAGPGIFNEDIFNQTTSRFGINTIGSSADSLSLIYLAGSMSEKLAIFFNKAVNIEKIVL
jgi:acetaldehyde dehydrogenase (acetylating)